MISNNDFEKKFRIRKFQNCKIKFRNFRMNKNFDKKQRIKNVRLTREKETYKNGYRKRNHSKES